MAADLLHAFRLIFTADREVWHITAVSLQVSIAALAAATVVALPVGYMLGRMRRAARTIPAQ